jgi:hypothetical protein
VSTQRWIKLRKIVRPLLVPAVVLLLKLDWRAALILSVSVVFVFGLPVMTGTGWPVTPAWPDTGPRFSAGAGSPTRRTKWIFRNQATMGLRPAPGREPIGGFSGRQGSVRARGED